MFAIDLLRKLSVSLGLFSAVTGVAVTAHADSSLKIGADSICQALFSPRPLEAKSGKESEADVHLWRLVVLYDRLRKSKPDDEMSGPQLNAALRVMDYSSAAYLSAQGIRFEPIPTLIEGNLGGRFYYYKYELQGAADGIGLSRTIHEFQNHPQFQDRKLAVIFDPLLATYMAGVYAEGMLTIGTSALLNRRIGDSDVFRHELQHYFEDLKVKRGKSTLARLRFSKGRKAAEPGPYKNFFQGDEIEAHLRDLRFDAYRKDNLRLDGELTESGFFAKAAEFGLVNTEAYVKQSIVVERQLRREAFNFFTEQTLKALEIAERRILANRGLAAWFRGSRAFTVKDSRLIFEMPDSVEYAEFTLDLQGGLISKRSSKREIQEAALREIRWSRERILWTQRNAIRLNLETSRAN